METNKESGDVILFEGQKYHCVAPDSEPWNHPEVGLRMSWLQARLPNFNFTPCRWRFICAEGVIAAVPLGYFEMRKPDAIPVEIRKKKEWHMQARPLTKEEQEIYRMTRSSNPQEGVERVVEDERQAIFNYIAAKLPNESESVYNGIMDLMEYEAIYANGNRDYFIRVELCKATLSEAALLPRMEQAGLKPVPEKPVRGKQPTEQYIFRRKGEIWEMRYESEISVFVTPRKGFEYISELLKHRDLTYSAPKLTQKVEMLIAPGVEFQDGIDDLHSTTGTRQAMMDKKGIAMMLKKRNELQAGLEKSLTEVEKREIEAEIETIQEYLKSNTFLGQVKVFKAQDDKDRARITKAIQEARKAITPHLPKLEQYLTRTIKTGYKFYYTGDIQFVL